jgi:hypothetical protein
VGIIGLGEIDGLGGRVIGDGRMGRLVRGVLGLKVGVVWIRPRLILRWGRGKERLTSVGGCWGEIGVRRVRAIMKIDGRWGVVLLVGRVRILVLRISGWWWWIVLCGGLARGDMVRNTRTTEDGFIGGDSLVRLSWTEWSVHHLNGRGERKGKWMGGKAGDDDPLGMRLER